MLDSSGLYKSQISSCWNTVGIPPLKERFWFFHKCGIWLIFVLTNLFQCYLSMSVWRVCVLFICTTSISILCVPRKELSFIKSIQQISNFKKSVIFEKQRHCGTLSIKFLISSNYSFDEIDTTVRST